MKRLFLLVVLVISRVVSAQIYVPVDVENSVTFAIRNFGVKIEGTFTGLAGEIHFNADHPESSTFNVSVDAASLNTGIDLRDKHLRKEDFFHVDKYKTIKFVSSGIKKGDSPGTWILKGNLTLKGHTKEITLPFKVTQVKDDSHRFSGEFKINRKDFDVGGRTLGMSDEVTVDLKVTARRKELL